MIKTLSLKEIDKLPENVIETLYIKTKIQKGLEDVKNNRVTTHKDFLKELNEWCSNGQTRQKGM